MLWSSLGNFGLLVGLVDNFKGVNVFNVALHLLNFLIIFEKKSKKYLIIFIDGQTEPVGNVNGILSLDPGHFYLGSWEDSCECG